MFGKSVGLSLLLAAAAVSAEKPNVLFISIDDLRPQLGAYGLDYMITPNLDRLASEGRLFKHHYVQVPTCGPSRACMLTGKNLRSKDEIQHTHLGESLAGSKEPETPETFVHHFKRNGYYTVGMGKISHQGDGHFGKGDQRGWELPHSWDEFVLDPNSPWKGGHALLHAYAKGKSREKTPAPAFECLDLSDTDYPDGNLANLATAQLEKLADGEQPFLMMVGFYKPHLPFSAPQKYWDRYERSHIPLSPNPDAPTGVDDVFLHSSSEFFKQYRHPERGGARKRISDEYAREVIHANFAATTYVDAQVGKVLDKLKALRLDTHTIVVVWGDHGWHLGDQTIWGKHSTFERALHSALMVKVPGMPKPGESTDGLVATVDLYPTLCELAGVRPPAGLDGESFAALLRNPDAGGREAVLSYWRDIVSMRTDRYRLALYDDGKKREMMLFDHENDPHETVNVAEQSPEVISRLMPLLTSLNKGYLPGLKYRVDEPYSGQPGEGSKKNASQY